jgi:hypothetical protein
MAIGCIISLDLVRVDQLIVLLRFLLLAEQKTVLDVGLKIGNVKLSTCKNKPGDEDDA